MEALDWHVDVEQDQPTRGGSAALDDLLHATSILTTSQAASKHPVRFTVGSRGEDFPGSRMEIELPTIPTANP